MSHLQIHGAEEHSSALKFLVDVHLHGLVSGENFPRLRSTFFFTELLGASYCPLHELFLIYCVKDCLRTINMRVERRESYVDSVCMVCLQNRCSYLVTFFAVILNCNFELHS
uniref:Uncharacterized protein n=1 Tax=Leersia perrieri TaxID=77586 RepID=A0A0D9WNZ9_9ORYZ